MIKRIFQDLDECILHTLVNSVPYEGEKYVEFTLGEDRHIYRTIIRPCVEELFQYYNSIVGKDNVYILTSATRDYAHVLNKLGEFGLDEDHIFSREDIQHHRTSIGWGGGSSTPLPIADSDNVLIDNLPSYDNRAKMNMIGITAKNYHQTQEYYGINFAEDDFLFKVKEFIEARR